MQEGIQVRSTLQHEQTQDAASVPVLARFYYPVRLSGGVVVHCFYEGEQGSGVELYCEAEQPVIFARERTAAGYCDELNAQQSALPPSLPTVATQFLLRYGHRARVVLKQNRRFLVLPMGVVASERSGSS